MKKKNVKKELVKSRKFKNLTPGQDRDFETLDANRMFKAYEEVEMDEKAGRAAAERSTRREKEKKEVASKMGKIRWRHNSRLKSFTKGAVEEAELSITQKGLDALKKDKEKRAAAPKVSITPKGRKALYKANVAYDTARQASKMKYMKKGEEIEVEDAPATNTGGVANWNPVLGGRKRKVDVYFKNRRGVDGRTKDYKETVTRLQARRDASAARELEQKLNMFGVQSNPFREETIMNNKKYLQTKEGGLESAVIQSLTTEAPVNPNDARPTLSLPKKYLSSKEGSLENAVETVMVDESISGNMIRDLRTLDSNQFNAKYRMTKAQAQTAGGGIQKYGRRGKTPDADEHQNEEVEDEFDYKAKKGAIAAPGSGSIAKPQKAKASDVNKSIEQQMAAARKEEVEIDEATPTSKQVKMAKGIAWDKRHRGGDMTGAWKKAEKIKKGLGDHPKVQKALRKANEEDDRGVGSQAYTDYIRNLTPGESGVKDKDSKESSSASKQASAEKKRQVTRIDDAVDPAVAQERDKQKGERTDMKKQHILDVAKIKASKVGEEVIVGLLDMGIIAVNENTETGFEVINDPVANRDNLLRMAYNTGAEILGEKDSRRTVDAIRAYDRSKDASRDADYDTSHGKAKRGDIEKEYAKKERGEIDKDDPRWKHRKGHTGMHGEEVSYHENLMAEAGKWIQKAIKKPGALRQQLGVPEGEKIPKSKLDAAAKEGGKLGQRARLAKTLSKMN